MSTKKSKESNSEAVKELFQHLEPFFEGILVTMKSFGLTERASYQQTFTDFLTKSGSNFYENFMEYFVKRLKQGFKESMDKMRDIPIDENFPKKIKDELDKWEYAKGAITVLFKPLEYAMANGASMTIDMIVKDKWNTDYLETLNNTFNLTTTLTKVFSDSRKNGNKMSVLPIKNILMLYKRENLNVRGQTPLIKTFEASFCQTSTEDYKTFANEYFKEGVHGFLPKAKQFIDDEDFRIQNAVDDEIGEKMRELLSTHFLKATLAMVYEKYDEIIEQDKEIEFQAITRLFSEIGELDKFADKTKMSFTQYCQNKINDRVSRNEEFVKNIPQIVMLLFEFLDRLEYMQKNYFMGDAIFKARLDNAFKEALITNKLTELNDKQDQIFPKYLASYANQLLKKGSKIEPDQEKVKQNIVKIGKMLQFVGNRDVFELQYMKNFQDRLVNDAVESTDLEMYTINELSNICDRQVSYKLRQINQEFQKSGELLEKFKMHAERTGFALPKFDFSFVVFSKPTSQVQFETPSFKVPPPLQNLFDKFLEFYKTTNNRTLMLNHSSTTGTIQFHLAKRPIQVMSRFYQMGIFLCFNEQKEITFAKLGEMTALSSENLALNLSGIVSKGVLECSTGKEFLPDSVIRYNMKFKPRLAKFSVQAADKSYAEKEEKKNEEADNSALEESRNDVIRARQVRIMKQRREMKYLELVNETVETLRSRFNVTSRAARVNIEYLINKEYFKRSENDRELLEYLA